MTVRITYDDHSERRARRPVADTVDDAPRIRRGRHLLVTTGYYRATVDVPRGRGPCGSRVASTSPI